MRNEKRLGCTFGDDEVRAKCEGLAPKAGGVEGVSPSTIITDANASVYGYTNVACGNERYVLIIAFSIAISNKFK